MFIRLFVLFMGRIAAVSVFLPGFVIVIFLFFMGFFVIVALFFHHAFHGFLSHCLCKIYQTQCFRSFVSHILEDPVHPHIVLTACVDEKIAILYFLDIQRSRFVGVHFFSGREKHPGTDGPRVTRDRSDKVVLREDRRHDLQSPVIRLLLLHRAARGCGRRNARCQNHRHQPGTEPPFPVLHFGPSFFHFVLLQSSQIP